MSNKTEVKETTAMVCCAAKCKSNFLSNCCFPWKCCCALRFPFPKKRLQSSSTPYVRFFNLKHLKDKALTALCLRKRPPSASPPKASLPLKPKPPISDSDHTNEAVKACIEYINSTSSSVTLSSSASASSSSASTCNLSGPNSNSNSVPTK